MHGMNQLMRGDLNVRLNDNHSSEFAFLIGTFNNMVLDISRLKIDVYEEKIHTQEAEFRLLQVQIRPHFYLNSLNIIASLASIKEYALIQKMTQHLAEYFRFIIHTKRNDVTLEAEIRHIENYLEIQKLRFPNQLEYRIEIPEQYRSCVVLPLTIQTFVENTIIHGFADRSKLLKIHIRVIPDDRLPDDFLWIIVSDTGVGFPPEVLSKLQDGSYVQEVFEEGHLGIQNILKRQQIRYEGAAIIIFNNIDEFGAEVRIGIPFIEVNKQREFANANSLLREEVDV
jgi:two-component system, sensor histidine kinase YesM